MRIKVINPNTTASMTEGIERAAKLYARPDTEIIAVNPKNGPASIENYHDESLAAVGLLEEIHQGEQEKVDAMIIACYGDVGLYAAREVASVPVIGIGEASMYLASIVAARFSIVTVISRSKIILEELLQRYGMTEKCVSIRSTNMSVLDFEENFDRGIENLARESKKALTEDGAEAICLGCAGMVSFVEKLEQELSVPVFDGVTAAVKLAESLVDLGKKTSKIHYFGYPERKEYKGLPLILQPK